MVCVKVQVERGKGINQSILSSLTQHNTTPSSYYYSFIFIHHHHQHHHQTLLFALLILPTTPFTFCKSSMYPKVKLRQEHQRDEYDGGDARDLVGLKAFLSLSFHSPTSPVKDHKVLSAPSIVKVPQVSIPIVSVTEDFGDCSLTSDSSGSPEPEKDEDTDESKVYIRANLIPRVSLTEHFGDGGLTSDLSGANTDDENKVNIRASSIPRPRAVISSPENDLLIGNRNKTGNGRLSTPKNSTVSPNRHSLAQCKVKSHDTTDIASDARKCIEPKSKDKTDPVGKKKVHKGITKSENLHRPWKF